MDRDLPDVGPPLIRGGPQVSPGLPAANRAADVLSRYPGHVLGRFASLPQRAIENSQHSLDTGTYDPASSLEAALLTLGGGAGGTGAAAGETALGAGFVGRKLPSDNYTGLLSRYTDELFREMSPREALEGLPTSVASGGPGMGGSRKFYADQPELALGQGQNRGVRVAYDAAPFEGQIHKKPGWEAQFPEGRAEYTAAPTTSLRETVKGFEIDPSTLSKVEKAQYQRLLSNLETKGWDVNRAADKITVTRPSGGQYDLPKSKE
jgi:hypothetical protein